MSQTRSGFTLIELLIVVVIIGILALIAVPTYSNTREKAFDAAAVSDLRNVIVAAEAYYADNLTYPSNIADMDFSPSPGVTFTRFKLETKLGRTREHRWAPRTIDLDLILYGEQIIDLPALRVPHPACWYRRFVLEPLAEIAPKVVHPEKGETIRRLRDRLLCFPFRLALSGADEHVRKRLIDRLAGEFKNVEIVDWSARNSVNPTILIWLGRPSDEPRRNAEIDDSVKTAWLDASRVTGEVEQFLREVLQSAFGSAERTTSD